MTYGYALQVLGIIVGLGAIGLTTLKVASMAFDRHTREHAAREGAPSVPGRKPA